MKGTGVSALYISGLVTFGFVDMTLTLVWWSTINKIDFMGNLISTTHRKTVTSLAIMLAYKSDWPLLILCPASLR